MNSSSGLNYLKHTDASDNPVFLRVIHAMINMMIESEAIEHVFIHRVNNWFDHKWLDLGAGKQTPVILADTDTHLPPFKPNRLLSINEFLTGCAAKEIDSEQYPSAVEGLRGDALFAWYTSNSQTNGQGAIMFFLYKDQTLTRWYASLMMKDKHWQIKQVRGIAKEFLENLLD